MKQSCFWVGLVCLLTLFIGCDNYSPSMKLAMLDLGKSAVEDSSIVSEYNALLSDAEAVYAESASDIAEMTIEAQRKLDDGGIYVSAKDILRGLSLMPSDEYMKPKFTRSIAAYIKERKSGKSHNDAISDLFSTSRSSY